MKIDCVLFLIIHLPIISICFFLQKYKLQGNINVNDELSINQPRESEQLSILVKEGKAMIEKGMVGN